ncbi:hypothetical protein [Solicola gregarius]|uniref:Uncharacterized protein n=1 Tax=Solicola gregarius TaxID=2908642 RepID=A0AA46YKJ2_9ACTN|nr:hypothetical protein [Solicola gregarius]UYM05562.1 hypothetical protein L0C25_00290 [Solicola gregarius]
MAISRHEINKDVLQQSAEAATHTAAEVGSILVNAVRDITSSVGDLATELFEIREAAARAENDNPPENRND